MAGEPEPGEAQREANGSRPAVESEPAAMAGCDVGAAMPAFYVRQLNSRRPDLASCLVCKYGARPVVTICARKLDAQVEGLIAAVDHTVDQHRGVGLRGFAIFVDGAAADLQPPLNALARRRQLSLPLALPVETGGPGSLELPPDETTILLYVQKKIVARYSFKSGELTRAEIERVIEAAEGLVAAAH